MSKLVDVGVTFRDKLLPLLSPVPVRRMAEAPVLAE